MMWYFIAGIIVIKNPRLKAIFCKFGWHTWELKKGGRRKCRWCNESQTRYRVGNDEGWR